MISFVSLVSVALIAALIQEAFCQCPGNAPATGACSRGCPQQSFCNKGACCPQPVRFQLVQQPQPRVPCPTGVMPTKPCGGGCPQTQSCFKGGCCPAPAPKPAPIIFQLPAPVRCPTGAVSQTPCGRGCPGRQTCFRGCCCPPPPPPPPQPVIYQLRVQCPTGQVSTTPCGGGCPTQQSCYKGCCCPRPPPPPQPAAVQQQCPSARVPVCQCASNNACPTQSSCSGSGVCCVQPKPQPVKYAIRVPQPAPQPVCPGAPCQQSSQCAGASAGCASCQKQSCQCTPGSYSNGAACAKATPVAATWSPRTSCNQFGSRCAMRFSTTRRSPVSMPDHKVNKDEKPVFFRALNEVNRTCQTDCTCTPEEVCVNGKCLNRMVPGEYGCQHDRQCSYDCATSYCHKKYGQCLCKGGFAFINFRACFTKCPMGTIPTQDGRCKTVQRKASFWNNKKTLKVIDNSHTCGPVPERMC